MMCLMLTGCAPVRGVLQRVTLGTDERMAQSVTIARDEWGVPTVYGPTDASVAFGLAYAQAEDNYWQVEEDYIHALGRAAGYYGEQFLAADLVKAAFEVERLSREEYAREPAERQAIWNAFAAGLNYYMRTSGVQPRVITRWEPWMLFAPFRLVSAGTVVNGVRLGRVAQLATGGSGAEELEPEPPVNGSNMWAIAPSRSASGHALLFQNPHVGFFGGGQRYEMQLHSEEGWHVRGFTVMGTPMPRSGYNEQLAWSHTNSAADHADAYEVTFDHPTDPLMYRFDGEWRRAVEWQDTLWVNTADGLVQRAFTFRKTHHGPVVSLEDGRGLAVRMARMEEGGSLQQWYDMGRATSLEGFRAALAQRAFPISNTMYADSAGNIFYLHGNAVPVRDTTFDWTRPVDGTTSRTEWRGYHELDQLPQWLNPPSGWLQNSNSTPYRAGSAEAMDASTFPRYMAPEADNARARRSRAILDADSSWTLDELTAAAFDTRVEIADAELDALVREWEEIGGTNPERAYLLDRPLDRLRAWDRVSTVDSEEMTLFVTWQERLRSGEQDGAYARFRAFENALDRMRSVHDTIWVSWGSVNRLQRPPLSRVPTFNDDHHSLAVAGAPGWTGMIFAFYSQRQPGTLKRYGTMGHTWVSTVELASPVNARSVVTFGQSGDRSSPHWFDQAPLYARGEMKRAWFTREDVLANARRVYSPGPQ